ncbi:hypothetical protein GO491_12065 [Flavobacteriaceae bacterium Ap0902]|nr:hypothetical protein [Flavobacteriaceae bacterium Ap0902]
MKIKDTNEAYRIFYNSAIDNINLFDGGDPLLANRYYKQMKQAFDFLNKNNQIDKLLPLLDDSNYGVQLWSASFLGKAHKDKVITVLQRIINLNIPHISLSAKYTLKEMLEEEE